MNPKIRLIPMAGLLASVVACTDRSADPGTAAAGVVDHHVHILGPDVMRDWKSVGVTFSRPDSIYLSAASLLAMRGDSLAEVTLVPMSHLYANPEFVAELAIDSAEAHRRVRRENAWVAAEAARYPGRASALCSVPALASWALEDLAWCRDSLRAAGIKLHLASSQVDLRESAHLDRLAEIAAFASAHGLPILLHVDPQRRGHDSTHIRALADRVFAPNADLTVIIAHLGGSGGYGAWTRTVHRTLRRWLREIERDGPARNVYFELSAVALERESEGVPAISADEAMLLRDDLRRDGFDRVLFGSDYPVFDPLQGARALSATVGLTAAEAEDITRRRRPPRASSGR
jgi:predicted TIM-barrel fold metal-dependent hydrolase